MKQRFTAKRNRATPGTQAVTRALAVLDALAAAGSERSLAALAEATDLDKATALRLLAALEDAEYVARRGAHGDFHLGPALIRLGVLARRATGLHDAARPVLLRLAESTGETATLEVLVGDETLIIDEAHGRFVVGILPEAGTRWPAHATSTGKVLLAAARHDAARHDAGPRARGGPRAAGTRTPRLAKRTPHTITSRAALARELDAIQARGYAVAQEELEPGFVAIGAPVRDADGTVVAAISIGGPSTRLTRARLARLAAEVCRAADRVSATLGAPPARAGPSPSPSPSARRPRRPRA